MPAKIIWTKIDEAPALATYSLLPIVQAYTKGTGVDVETSDISLAGRIIANFPEKLTRRAEASPTTWRTSATLAQTPEANIVKLPNISASIPQLQAAIKELQDQGYDIPDYPEEPRTEDEKALQARFAKVLGSAVNPVLREGNADRRAAVSVKKFAQKNPHRMMKDWPATGSQVPRRPHDGEGLLRQREVGHRGQGHRRADRVHRRRRQADRAEGEARPARRRGHRHLGDERGRPAPLLRRDHRRGQARRRAAVAAPEGHHDEDLRPDHVRPLRRRSTTRPPWTSTPRPSRRSAPTSTTAWPTCWRSWTSCPPPRRPRSRPTSPRSTPPARPWPWSTRARASPTCTCPTT